MVYNVKVPYSCTPIDAINGSEHVLKDLELPEHLCFSIY